MNDLVSFRGRVPSFFEALLILQGCREGILPMVNRRLTDAERRQIYCGDVFVFDEGISGIKRWADGRLWSSSRMRDCFLVYVEIGLASGVSGFSSRRITSATPAQLLRKKVLSITAATGERLRLVAYSNAMDDDSFTPTHPQISGITPRQDPRLSHLRIPPGLFQSSQAISASAVGRRTSTSHNANNHRSSSRKTSTDATCTTPICPTKDTATEYSNSLCNSSVSTTSSCSPVPKSDSSMALTTNHSFVHGSTDPNGETNKTDDTTTTVTAATATIPTTWPPYPPRPTYYYPTTNSHYAHASGTWMRDQYAHTTMGPPHIHYHDSSYPAPSIHSSRGVIDPTRYQSTMPYGHSWPGLSPLTGHPPSSKWFNSLPYSWTSSLIDKSSHYHHHRHHHPYDYNHDETPGSVPSYMTLSTPASTYSQSSNHDHVIDVPNPIRPINNNDGSTVGRTDSATASSGSPMGCGMDHIPDRGHRDRSLAMTNPMLGNRISHSNRTSPLPRINTLSHYPTSSQPLLISSSVPAPTADNLIDSTVVNGRTPAGPQIV